MRFAWSAISATCQASHDSGPGVTNSYDGFGWLRSSSSNMGGVTRTVGLIRIFVCEA